MQIQNQLWSSVIASQEFRNHHLNIASSSPTPRLLIAFEDFYGAKLPVVSIPNPNVVLSFSSYKDLSMVNIKGKIVYNAGRGLICVGAGFENVGICNPSTRQVHNLPDFKFKQTQIVCPRPMYIFGYDPVGDQYKVLALDDLPWRLEHKIVVLGGEETWRESPCVACPHVVCTKGLYMNGTVYYGAFMKDIDSPYISIIVRFDVRFETFNIFKVPSKLVPVGYEFMWKERGWSPTDKTLFESLINYGGKIGVVESPRVCGFRLWVGEDAEKEEWSMSTLHLPESYVGVDFEIMDTFSSGEVCLVSKEWSDPFRLFYYNLEKKSMRSVAIEGLPISDFKKIQALSVTVSFHYESLLSL
ncbi:PREDICTED: LOW QUALITY PROTEIN: putative F-box protein At3g47150 [Brassica oleracea var. oleracea]|nr:PREDICTED: LOW QUALITY PROTEIN: putative F-box protein At3g47150 [Brassica oleracea var. oleracea]